MAVIAEFLQSQRRAAACRLPALQVDHRTSRAAAQTNGRFHVNCQILDGSLTGLVEDLPRVDLRYTPD